MNSRLMYSRVVLVTGTKRVVPGWLAFHWLKSNRPGSVVGSGARPGCSSRRARRKRLSSAVDLLVHGAPRQGRHLARLGELVEHLQHVEAGVVGEEELGAVVRAGAGPGARGPLDEGAHAARRVQVAQVEPGEAGPGDAQQRLLQLGEGHRLVRAGVGEDVRADRHAQADAPALAVEDALEEGVLEGVEEPRSGRGFHGFLSEIRPGDRWRRGRGKPRRRGAARNRRARGGRVRVFRRPQPPGRSASRRSTSRRSASSSISARARR